jgi:transposase-like protein
MEFKMSIAHCPNKDCTYHCGNTPRIWCKPHGSYETATFGTVPRFRCLCCGKTFSPQTFSIDYYAKKVLSYKQILEELGSGAGCIDMARICGCDSKTILNKLDRLARNSVALQSQALKHITEEKTLCYDGFESFSYSQFFPNNIGVLVGAKSQFLYSLDYATLRRKGRMTKKQKQIRAVLDQRQRVPKGSLTRTVRQTMEELHQRLVHKGNSGTNLYSDEHQVYKNVLKKLADSDPRITHQRVSSRLHRNHKNPLFPVNYIDRQIRKDNSDHHRETVQFAKTPAGMMSRMAIYRMLHNFHKPYRIKDARKGETRTHAEVAGLSSGKLGELLEGLVSKRYFLSKLEMGQNERRLWFGQFHLPGVGITKYRPKFLNH